VRLRFIEIEGKRYAWADILRLRREQRRAMRQPQPTLFPYETIHGRRLRRPRRADTKARRCSMTAQQGGAIETLILSAPA
jgi:hypothetical protein